MNPLFKRDNMEKQTDADLIMCELISQHKSTAGGRRKIKDLLTIRTAAGCPLWLQPLVHLQVRSLRASCATWALCLLSVTPQRSKNASIRYNNSGVWLATRSTSVFVHMNGGLCRQALVCFANPDSVMSWCSRRKPASLYTWPRQLTEVLMILLTLLRLCHCIDFVWNLQRFSEKCLQC